VIQESPTWDWRQLHPVLSTSMRIYLLFLLLTRVVTTAKLVRAWRAAPPFRLVRQAGNPNYIRSLRASSTSLKHWVACVFIGWGICASTSIYEFCVKLLDEKQIGSFAIFFAVLGFSSTLTMTLLVVLFAVLVRWHLIQRIENPGTS
jgi:hypothetical protein